MTDRERFLNIFQFKIPDRIPNFEIGTWTQTEQRWINEGLPSGLNTGDFFSGNEYFRLDGIDVVSLDALAPYPPIEEKILEEDDNYVTFSDEFKRVRKALKSGTVAGQRMSMDQYISFPIIDRRSFLEYKKGYEFDFDKRYPANWGNIKQSANASDRLLSILDPMIGTFGFYSMLRNWMGTEGVSYMFYDDPELVEECIEFLGDFIMGMFEKALSEIQFDLYYIHEDMCYNSGPLVSPEIFRKLFLPYYKKFISFLKAKGIKTVLVDTDGNFEKLIPLFLETGVDGFGPIEIAAGMDPVKIRKEYGNSICMMGGVDKREIAKGRKEIEEELKRRVVPIIDKGGFIPSIDHAIPPSISLENFNYYLGLKEKILKGDL